MDVYCAPTQWIIFPQACNWCNACFTFIFCTFPYEHAERLLQDVQKHNLIKNVSSQGDVVDDGYSPSLCTIAGAPPGFRTVFTDGSDGCIVGKVLIVPLMSGSSLEVSEGLGAPPPVSCAICDG